jgi:hypothetical protein
MSLFTYRLKANDKQVRIYLYSSSSNVYFSLKNTLMGVPVKFQFSLILFSMKRL